MRKAVWMHWPALTPRLSRYCLRGELTEESIRREIPRLRINNKRLKKHPRLRQKAAYLAKKQYANMNTIRGCIQLNNFDSALILSSDKPGRYFVSLVGRHCGGRS